MTADKSLQPVGQAHPAGDLTLFRLYQQAVAQDARVGHHTVQPAEVACDLPEQVLDLGLVRHVGDIGAGGGAACLQFRHGLVQPVPVEVHQGQAGALFRQGPGNAQAKSLGAARHDNHFFR